MNMEKMNNIREELIQISPLLANAERLQVYQIPTGYFENLTNEINEKVIAGVEPVYHLSTSNPYIVPNNYFEELAETLMHKVKSVTENTEVFNELETIAPLLNKISKKPVLTTPAGYFANGNDFLSATKSSTPTSAKVVPIRSASKWMRYAAAAVIAVILGTGAFFISGEKDNNLAKVEVPKVQVNKLSEQDIMEYLKTNSALGDAATTSYKTSAKESDIWRSVSKMSDKEIKDFLKENGEADEI